MASPISALPMSRFTVTALLGVAAAFSGAFLLAAWMERREFPAAFGRNDYLWRFVAMAAPAAALPPLISIAGLALLGWDSGIPDPVLRIATWWCHSAITMLLLAPAVATASREHLRAWFADSGMTAPLLASLVALVAAIREQERIERTPLEGPDRGLAALARQVRELETRARYDAPAAVADVTEVVIADDGRGMNLPQPGMGIGLRTMGYRTAMCGGSLRVESQPGRGTRVICRVPRRRPAAGQGPSSLDTGGPDADPARLVAIGSTP